MFLVMCSISGSMTCNPLFQEVGDTLSLFLVLISGDEGG